MSNNTTNNKYYKLSTKFLEQENKCDEKYVLNDNDFINWSRSRASFKLVGTFLVLLVLAIGGLINGYIWAGAKHDLITNEIRVVDKTTAEQEVKIKHLNEQMKIINSMNQSLKNIEKAIIEKEEK